MAASQKGATRQKGNAMEIKKCRGCGKTLGVVTENGFMVGNVIASEFRGVCGCGHYFGWKTLETKHNVYEHRGAYEGEMDDFEE